MAVTVAAALFAVVAASALAQNSESEPATAAPMKSKPKPKTPAGGTVTVKVINWRNADLVELQGGRERLGQLEESARRAGKPANGRGLLKYRRARIVTWICAGNTPTVSRRMCPISISARTKQSTWSTDAPEASGARNLGICLMGAFLIAFIGGPLGASRTADEFCALAKAGVLSAVSVGFRPIDAEPIKNGRGVLWKAWELLELSLVAVPSNPNAVVMERAFGKDGRDADALERAHQRITSARRDLADVLKAAGRPPPADDGEEDPDEELAFDAARLKAQRAADLASLDRLDVGARAKPSAPQPELRGGPWLVAHVREQEAARLRAFWNAPLK